MGRNPSYSESFCVEQQRWHSEVERDLRGEHSALMTGWWIASGRDELLVVGMWKWSATGGTLVSALLCWLVWTWECKAELPISAWQSWMGDVFHQQVKSTYILGPWHATR